MEFGAVAVRQPNNADPSTASVGLYLYLFALQQTPSEGYLGLIPIGNPQCDLEDDNFAGADTRSMPTNMGESLD